MKKSNKDESFEVPMVAFCYSCSTQFTLYPTGALLKKCPACGSKEIDNWGVEVTKK
jgi:predicted RNA-binding Zn-ribbon protein involved in translation (DUF1610 family)